MGEKRKKKFTINKKNYYRIMEYSGYYRKKIGVMEVGG